MRRLLLILIALALCACQKHYMPKPKAYFRIDFPEKTYAPIKQSFPFCFEKANYTQLKQLEAPKGQIWINLTTPANKADIHLSYEKLNHNLEKHSEEARKLAYDHSIKANAINDKYYENPDRKVYGMLYQIEGNAASPLQFFLTDSCRHFLRGAFYIREIPNIDSIQPVIQFFETDVRHLIETLEWTN